MNDYELLHELKLFLGNRSDIWRIDGFPEKADKVQSWLEALQRLEAKANR